LSSKAAPSGKSCKLFTYKFVYKEAGFFVFASPPEFKFAGQEDFINALPFPGGNGDAYRKRRIPGATRIAENAGAGRPARLPLTAPGAKSASSRARERPWE